MRIGLVLSGGGARGIAHLGALKALEEMKIRISVISGVSSGALIGALYASGKSPVEILELVRSHEHTNLVSAFFLPGSLFSSKGLRSLLESVFPVDDFSTLSMPLYVSATDLISGTTACLSTGKLHNALMGSAAIPGLFDPVPLNNYKLVDGGILDNFPVKCIRGLCDKIIGVHVNKYYLNPEKWSRSEIIERSFHLAIAKGVSENGKLCDLLIEPDLSAYSIFAMKYADQLFTIGYRSVMLQFKIMKSWDKD